MAKACDGAEVTARRGGGGGGGGGVEEDEKGLATQRIETKKGKDKGLRKR